MTDIKAEIEEFALFVKEHQMLRLCVEYDLAFEDDWFTHPDIHRRAINSKTNKAMMNAPPTTFRNKLYKNREKAKQELTIWRLSKI